MSLKIGPDNKKDQRLAMRKICTAQKMLLIKNYFDNTAGGF